MGRNIVVCLDGTNNKYEATNTNVVKLYAMLDRHGQPAYYQPGIGTMPPPGMWGKFKKRFVTSLDLAIAWLLEEHVTDAYRFLMRCYEEGDQIFLFGFSRGAYTARVLAGMLYKVGLLSQGNEELIPFAWDIFQRDRDLTLATGFRHTFSRKVRIRFLGVWDTVSSVGWAQWNPRHYQFTKTNPCVDVVRHAVALDERRTYFVQNLWGSLPDQDVKKVWFPGVHCDVGGGYPEKEAGLSKIALAWMAVEAEAQGLKINSKARAAILPEGDSSEYSAPNPFAPKHESLRGLWWLPECLPKRIRDPANNWAPRWIWPLGRYRRLLDGALIYGAVFLRRSHDPSYNPTNLPAAYTEVERGNNRMQPVKEPQMKIMDIAFQRLDDLEFGKDVLERSRQAPGVLTVPVSAPPKEVARLAERENADVILVLGDGEEIRGLIAPHWVKRQVAKYLQMEPESFSGAVAALEETGLLKSMFSHEWLNFERPDLKWCKKAGHYTFTLPCPDHP